MRAASCSKVTVPKVRAAGCSKVTVPKVRAASCSKVTAPFYMHKHAKAFVQEPSTSAFCFERIIMIMTMIMISD